MTPEQLSRSGTEEAHQIALMQMSNMHLKQFPELKWLHHAPNGGSRGDVESAKIRGGKLKAAGVKPGIPDLFLPVKRLTYSGLYVEMKKPGKLNTLSKEQKEYRDFVREQGFAWFVSDNWETAWQGIKQYLEQL